MNIPVARTKITLPKRRDEILTRQRLLDMLYDLMDNRLVILSAPAGYGKTSLLVDLASQVELPFCWYSIDALDRDPYRFIAHFIAAIQQRFPDFGEESFAALRDNSLTGTELDRLVTIVVNEAYENIREHFALILDDYHLVEDAHSIQYFINRFIQEVDENCHLVLSARTLVDLPDLPLMVARSQVTGLSFEELAFTASEIQALVLQNYHLTISDETAEELAQGTEGWVTALLLSALTIWRGMTNRLQAPHITGIGLYEYMAQQVLEQQAPAVRNFLLRTSLLEEFDAELCEQIFGQVDSSSDESWEELIEAILHKNLFVLPVGESGNWLRYHHLFRDFLQEQMLRQHPEEVHQILHRLAKTYSNRFELEKAHDIYQKLGDVAADAQLLEDNGHLLLQNGRLSTLVTWLDNLPNEIMISSPSLLSLRGGVGLMQGEVQRGLILLDQAVDKFNTRIEHSELAVTLIRRSTAQRFLGRYEFALADAEQAISLVTNDNGQISIQAEAFRTKGLCLHLVGQLDEAIVTLKNSLAAYTLLNNEENQAKLLMELGMMYRTKGTYTSAQSVYSQALELLRKTGNIAWQANLLNNLGVLFHHHLGDYEQAASRLEEALVYARRSGYSRVEAYSLTSIGDLYKDLDAWDTTQQAYRQAHEIAVRIEDRFLLLYLDLKEAEIARKRGNFSRSHLLLEKLNPMIHSASSKYEKGLFYLEKGKLALAEGKFQLAQADLKMAVTLFEDIGQRVDIAEALLYQAYALNKEESSVLATQTVERVCQLLPDLADQHAITVVGREIKDLLNSDFQTPATLKFSRRLLDIVNHFEERIPATRRRLRRHTTILPASPPRITIQTFGRIQIKMDGVLVTSSDWQTQVARDLFLLLLEHPEGLTKEEIGLIFWPDHSPAKLKLQFKNTIYRLRHAIGQDVVVFIDNRYLFNQGLDYEYDVEQFLSKINLAEKAQEIEVQIVAYKAAIDLYRGSYLSELDGEWVYQQRENLWQANVGAVLSLSAIYLQQGAYMPVIDTCQQLLTIDPCIEEAYRLTMRAYAALGDRPALARVFERCRDTLSSEINVPPSKQTVSLYQILTK